MSYSRHSKLHQEKLYEEYTAVSIMSIVRMWHSKILLCHRNQQTILCIIRISCIFRIVCISCFFSLFIIFILLFIFCLFLLLIIFIIVSIIVIFYIIIIFRLFIIFIYVTILYKYLLYLPKWKRSSMSSISSE